MPARIYLGIDSHTNRAISLETAADGVFFLTMSEGSKGEDLCKFLCSEEDLMGVIHNRPFEVSGNAGTCEVHPAGDEVLIEFKLTQDQALSTCTLTTNSFARVVTVARNRAYIT